MTHRAARRTLLWSKLGFMGLVVVLPVLLGEIVVLACNGIAGRNLLLAVPEILLTVLSRLSVLGVLAALTANFARFAVAGVSYFVAMGIVSFLANIFVAPRFHGAAESMFNVSLMQSRDVVGSIATILVGGFVLAWQYLTRKTAASVSLAILGALGIVVTQSAWHTDFLQGEDRSTALIGVNPADVALTLAGVEPKATPGLGPRKYQILDAVIEVEGIPRGHAVEVADGKVTFTRSNGHSMSGEASPFNFEFYGFQAPLNCPGIPRTHGRVAEGRHAGVLPKGSARVVQKELCHAGFPDAASDRQFVRSGLGR